MASAAEAGHAPNRFYFDRDGDAHMNGSRFVNSDNNDISPQLDVLDTLVAAELAFLDGAVAGTPAASKTLVYDSNVEANLVGVIKSTDTLIATAAVLTLNATPVTVVAAPGAGVYSEFLGAFVFLDFNAAAYVDDAGEDLAFSYTNASGAEVGARVDGSLLDGTADALIWVPHIGPDIAVGAIEMVDNAVIQVHLLVGEWVTGDSPLKIRVFHRDIRKASLEAIA